jgi:hypothetical protein
MATFTKQPGDVYDYDIDMSKWFAEVPGDDIQSVAVTVTSDTEATPTLVAGPSPHPAVVLIGAEPVRFKVWVGGGTNFNDYKVNCLVTTEQDRVKEVEFSIKVRDK